MCMRVSENEFAAFSISISKTNLSFVSSNTVVSQIIRISKFIQASNKTLCSFDLWTYELRTYQQRGKRRGRERVSDEKKAREVSIGELNICLVCVISICWNLAATKQRIWLIQKSVDAWPWWLWKICKLSGHRTPQVQIVQGIIIRNTGIPCCCCFTCGKC